MQQKSVDKEFEARAPLELSPDEFRELGYRVIDRIAQFLQSLSTRQVAPNESASSLRKLIELPLPEKGQDADFLLQHAMDLLQDHSTFNSHPRFWGYITGSPAPIGALADTIASALNPNLGKWMLSPVATEIERQTVGWIAQMLDYPADCGGLLVSGGSMANFIGFLAARRAKLPWPLRVSGMADSDRRRPRVYTSAETHVWVQKAADLFGLGTDSIRWVSTDEHFRMDPAALRKCLDQDLSAGDLPFLVIGTAGSVGTGAVDPLPELADISREYGLWFHVDGAYGGFAAMVPDASSDLRGLAEADSIAVDPHKWMYAPLEAGCALVRNATDLRDTFSYRPQYYHLDADPADDAINYFEYGPQNARGFRALKVWLCLQHAGVEGYRKMIGSNIRLARELYELVNKQPTLEALTCSLSITTFRYLPADLKGRKDTEDYLNQLNSELLTRIQQGGKAFISNAIIRGKFALRACIVNFRTCSADLRALVELVTSTGAKLDATLRSPAMKSAGT
ncbi:MAG TPA: aspartate aminotransferase family protein [Candidatus Eremiobacteraceae bacterium]|nr:aspartate aminotransferase family protein [Candidatus Eremiobacteraceae bacterium]